MPSRMRVCSLRWYPLSSRSAEDSDTGCVCVGATTLIAAVRGRWRRRQQAPISSGPLPFVSTAWCLPLTVTSPGHFPSSTIHNTTTPCLNAKVRPRIETIVNILTEYALCSSQQVLSPGFRSVPHSPPQATQELPTGCSPNGPLLHVSPPRLRTSLILTMVQAM